MIGAECGQQARQGSGPDLGVRLDLRVVRSGVGFLGFTERGGMPAAGAPGTFSTGPLSGFPCAVSPVRLPSVDPVTPRLCRLEVQPVCEGRRIQSFPEGGDYRTGMTVCRVRSSALPSGTGNAPEPAIPTCDYVAIQSYCYGG